MRAARDNDSVRRDVSRRSSRGAGGDKVTPDVICPRLVPTLGHGEVQVVIERGYEPRIGVSITRRIATAFV